MDGSLDILHNEKRFPGYDHDSKEYDANMHKEHIFGGHVGEYMEYLEEEDGQKYQVQFASYIANCITMDGLQEMYKMVHEAIRGDPSSPTSARLSLPLRNVRHVFKLRRIHMLLRKRTSKPFDKLVTKE